MAVSLLRLRKGRLLFGRCLVLVALLPFRGWHAVNDLARLVLSERNALFGRGTDVLIGGKVVARYMYAHDKSTPKRLDETYKPYLHIFDADGKRLLSIAEIQKNWKRFANRQFASVVPRPVFINGRAVAPALLTLPEQRLQDAPVLMGSPQIAPASAQRVAHVATTTVQTDRKNAPPGRQAVGISRKGGGRLIRITAMPRGHGQPVLIRGAHLYAPSYAGLSRSRQVIVLRAAHSPKGGARKGERR